MNVNEEASGVSQTHTSALHYTANVYYSHKLFYKALKFLHKLQPMIQCSFFMYSIQSPLAVDETELEVRMFG